MNKEEQLDTATPPLLEQLLNRSHDGLLALDSNGLLQFANQAARAMLPGATFERGRQVTPQSLGITAGRCASVIDRVLLAKESSGSCHYATDHGAQLQISVERSPSGILVTVADAKPQILESALRQLPPGILIAGHPDGKILLASESMAAMVREEHSTFQSIPDSGQYTCRKLNGEPYTVEQAALTKAFRDGEIVEGEEIFCTRSDGSEARLRVSSRPIRDEDGSVLAAVAVFDDVTKTRKAEQALREAGMRFSLLNSITAGVSSGMPVDEILAHCVNRIGDAFPQFSAGFCRYEHAPRVLVADNVEACEAGVREDLSSAPSYLAAIYRREPVAIPDVRGNRLLGGLAEALEERDIHAILDIPIFVRENLTGILFLDAKEPYEWSDDEILTLTECGRYLSLAVSDAEALRERSEAVEERDRQAAILAHSNEELEQFAYIVSHDLKEPLRTIASYTQLLERRYQGKLDKDADEFIRYIVSGVKRMQDLISDLLAYSQAGAKQGESRTPTKFEEVLNWAKMNLTTAIKENQAEITHDSLPTVTIDSMRFLQVMQNLIGNAIKYRREEPPRIHLGVKRTDGFYEFELRDNGQGFEPTYRERVFGVFRRLHGKEYPGTGVGLAICKKIVESHGGEIWVEPVRGEGCRFFFTIPADE